MIETEAWVLYERSGAAQSALDSGDFRLEKFSFPAPASDECWSNRCSAAGRAT
ncbi:hypothetical protein OV079_53110 [Nannocystis pusilla]|uniref:Uncharacterized protein n=1 Tax=Nannocystis pusilla TaxID=889268 RepID=A0A9X3F992_9BACT|nr:hypothetical protein [Nannocystis pusilla]MCY1014118.1 hypothetical protein [Nannocystis pusilla]